MTHSPQGQHNGFSYTLEWRMATRVAWRYRSWAYRYGLDNAELAHDLLPAAVIAAKHFDPALGSNKQAHVYRACRWEAVHIFEKMETQRKFRDRYSLRRHGHAARADADLEQREIVQLAMSAMNARDRMIVSSLLGGATLRYLAERHGVTYQRIGQLADRAIRDARHALRKEAVRVGSTLDECWR